MSGTVYIVDQSGAPASAMVAISKALDAQAYEFANVWGLEQISVFPTLLANVPPGAPRIVIVKEPPNPDEYGDHTEAGDVPVGTVATAPIFASGGDWTDGQNGVSVSSVVSHELLEMWKNPFGSAFVLQYLSMRFFPFEMCDWVQGSSYKINDVLVSNFLFPPRSTNRRASRNSTGSAPYRHRSRLLPGATAFSIRFRRSPSDSSGTDPHTERRPGGMNESDRCCAMLEVRRSRCSVYHIPRRAMAERAFPVNDAGFCERCGRRYYLDATDCVDCTREEKIRADERARLLAQLRAVPAGPLAKAMIDSDRRGGLSIDMANAVRDALLAAVTGDDDAAKSD